MLFRSLLLFGCHSVHLGYFRAAPLRYCANTKTIAVSWFTDAKRVTVTATPPVPELAEPRQDGVKRLPIEPRPSAIQLDFGEKDNRPAVQIAPLEHNASQLTGGFVAGCIDGNVVAPFEFDPDLYAPDVVVTALKNPLDVAITVEHVGASWHVAPSAELALSSAATAAGDPSRHLPHTWTIRAPSPDHCADATRRPNTLGVVMTLECAP